LISSLLIPVAITPGHPYRLFVPLQK